MTDRAGANASMPMIAEAIAAHWGPRCSEPYEGCPCCDAWAEYDAMIRRAEADVEVERLHASLGNVTVPDIMYGDNLAITLCAAYDNPDQDVDDETGWTPDAISGQEAVLAAIRAHYDPALCKISADRDAHALRAEQAERREAALLASNDADRMALRNLNAERYALRSDKEKLEAMLEREALPQSLSAVTRVEVIDHVEGVHRAYNRRGAINVSIDLQDDGRTLKVFVEPQQPEGK